ncbi:MAG TPA: hypothetical protein DEV93_16070 [Chloroflexi bacterium]|nr:hypothetical protein [Chloroflexota bacterium]
MSGVSIERRLLIIVGQEGTGKSTLTRALVPHVQPGAAIDAEDVGQVNPWQWNDAFKLCCPAGSRTALDSP